MHRTTQQAHKEKENAEEEKILQQEADDACAQWVSQMTNLSKIAMPLSCRIASIVIALISVVLAAESFWSPATVDAPVLISVKTSEQLPMGTAQATFKLRYP